MIYIALLRGINVGGKNKIKMADLKQILINSGLQSVQTFIQSGNVLFESTEEESGLKLKLEEEIQKAFQFPVPVILRTAGELEQLIRNKPFSNEQLAQAAAATESETFYVALFAAPIPEKDLEKLATVRSGKELFQAAGRDLYLLFDDSVRNSKMSGVLQRMSRPPTIRNWNTLNKLLELAKSE